ncbi:MAG: PfkB family carbohydrate kinase, partial [Synergistaceae bacterium]|nr:PfkB family carbohydrate kinase [Synergistaceae bacterium]
MPRNFIAELGLSKGLVEKARQICSGRLKDCRIAVAGDLMLDCYISGKVKRISPEAPVPVVRMTDEKFVLGGAGNALANLSGLGVQIIPAGRLGSDADGEKFLANPVMCAANTAHIIKKDVTSIKTRILGGHQQMLRLDREHYIETTEKEAKEIAASLMNEKPGCVIISDYGKGFCSEALCRELAAQCAKNTTPLLVDPKKADWSCYSGAYLITPNVKELGEASGREIKNEDSEIVNAARELLQKYGIENVLVTRSEKGASLVSKTEVKHIQASAVEVYDVSGAGDTTISTIAAFLAAG